MNHKKTIEKYTGTIMELWEDIGNLDYDTLAELFKILSIKFQNDAIKDTELWHPKVTKRLENISKRLKDILEEEAQPLADLCRPYNKKGIK